MALGLCEGVASAGSPGIRVGRGGGEVPSPLRDMGRGGSPRGLCPFDWCGWEEEGPCVS